MVLVHFHRKEGNKEENKEEEGERDKSFWSHPNLTCRKSGRHDIQTPLAQPVSLTLLHQDAKSTTFLQNGQKASTQKRDGERKEGQTNHVLGSFLFLVNFQSNKYLVEDHFRKPLHCFLTVFMESKNIKLWVKVKGDILEVNSLRSYNYNANAKQTEVLWQFQTTK